MTSRNGRFTQAAALLLLLPALLAAPAAEAAASERDRTGRVGIDSLAPGPTTSLSFPLFRGVEGDASAGAYTGLAVLRTGTAFPKPQTWTLTWDGAAWAIEGSVDGSAGTVTNGNWWLGEGLQLYANHSAPEVGVTMNYEVVASLDLRDPSVDAVRTFVPSPDAPTVLSSSLVAPHNPNGSFRAYGSTYATIRIHPAGYLDLVQSSDYEPHEMGPTRTVNEPLPTRAFYAMPAAHVLLAPFWDALQVKPESRVHFAPSFQGFKIVQWTDFAHRDDPEASLTFQVLLNASSEQIFFHYLELQNGSGALADGRSATVGIQPYLPTAGWTSLQYGFQSEGLLQEGLYIEYGNDADGDRIPDLMETRLGTEPSVFASDQGSLNGTVDLSDGAQLFAGLDPLDPSDNPTDDSDADGLYDVEESFAGLDPDDADSDGDGFADGDELALGTDPLDADSDDDGVSDGAEVDGGTDPLLWDSDDDGVSDGLELATETDPLSDLSSPAPYSNAGFTRDVRGRLYASLDSGGHLHVLSHQNNQGISVTLLGPNGSGGLEVRIGETVLAAATNDAQTAGIATLPGTGEVDRTFLVPSNQRGEARLIELDFNEDSMDADAAVLEDILVASHPLALPHRVQHPTLVAGDDGNLHLVYLGDEGLPNDTFIGQRARRGIYALRLSTSGEILAGPTQLLVMDPPNHPHWHPTLALGTGGNLHGVVRAGSCGWSRGARDCDIYYFELASDGTVRIPATRLGLGTMGGIERAPSVAIAPNGNVAILYSAADNFVPDRYEGAWSFGRGLTLHMIDTSEGAIQTVIDRKQVVSEAPPIYELGDSAPRFTVAKVSSLTLDPGGNIHIGWIENGRQSRMNHLVLSPAGEPLIDGIHLEGNNWTKPVIFAEEDRTILVFEDGATTGASVAIIDTSSFGLDMSGAGQPAAPAYDAPTLDSVTPDAVGTNGGGRLTLAGSNFTPDASASVGGVALTSLVIEGERIEGDLPSDHGLSEGSYDVTVRSANGDEGVLTRGFRVGTPPVAFSVAPSEVPSGVASRVFVSGRDFDAGMTVTVGGVAAEGVTVVSPSLLEVTLSRNLPLGAHDVVVAPPSSADELTTTLTQALTVAESGWGCASVTDSGGFGVWALLALAALGLARRRRVG